MRKQLKRIFEREMRTGPQGLTYIAPGVNWSLDWDGHYITSEISTQFNFPAEVQANAKNLSNRILHYGSLWDMAANSSSTHNRRNYCVGTIFHGNREDPAFRDSFQRVLTSKSQFIKIHTSTTQMRDRLIGWGVSPNKVVCIPLGVDLKRFTPAKAEERTAVRERLDIPLDAFCIGSFHKDGVGMEVGDQPKLVKGPDIFLEVIERVSRETKIFVLLSAPARGFVKRGLEILGVPYKHVVLQDYFEIPSLYHALDMYLVTSREEGGPKGLLESMATGIPLVSTNVGMAIDMVVDGMNGLVANSEDIDGLVKRVNLLAADTELRSQLAANGQKTITEYDWSMIAARYYKEIYKPIIDSPFL